MPSTHSELPPSSSDKWLVCHDWLRLTRSIPENLLVSASAEEGTEAHSLFEKCLLGTMDDADLAGEFSFHLPMCLEWARAQPGKLHVEVEIDYGAKFGYVDLTGTSDLVIEDTESLMVADLKFGYGLVEVEDNPQILCYLSGAVHKFGPRPWYSLAILQPRAWHPKGSIRVAKITHDELERFEHKLEVAIALNYKGGKAKTGGHCRNYCPALAICPEVKRVAMDRFRSTPL